MELPVGGDGETAIESKEGEDVEERTVAVLLPPAQLRQGRTQGLIEGREADADAPIASAVVESVEKEKSENGERNSGESRGSASRVVENAEGIEDEGKDNDGQGLEKGEEVIGSVVADQSTGERTIDVEVSSHVDEEEAQDGFGGAKEVPDIVEGAKEVPASVEEVREIPEVQEAPVVPQESKKVPASVEEVKEAPDVPEEAKELPAVPGKIEEAPAVPGKIEEAPAALGKIEEASSVLGERKEAPVVLAKSEEASSVLEERKEAPADLEKSKEVPAIVEAGKEASNVVEEAKEAPAVLGKSEEAPVVLAKSEEESSVLEERKEVPADLKETKEVPAVIESVPVLEQGNEVISVHEKAKEMPSVLEESAVPEEGKIAPDNIVDRTSDQEGFAAVEMSENGSSNKANSREVSADVHEKSENGDAGEMNLGKIDSHEEPGNGLLNEVHFDELIDQTQQDNVSPELKDTSGSGSMDASADKQVEATQGESPALVVPTKLNGKCAARTDESVAKDWQDTRSGGSDHSEVTDRSKELKVTKDVQEKDNGKKLSIGEKSAPRELLKGKFIREVYDELSSTTKGGTEPGTQNASAVSGSSGSSIDLPRAPRRPAGLGSSASLLEPAPRVLQQQLRVNGSLPQRQVQLVEDPTINETEEYDETREKLQMIRVKFLRLAHRLGQTPHNVVVAQVLYRLGLAEQLRGSRNVSRSGAFSFDRASAMAEQLEGAGQEPLDFSCTIMVIGKTGVGKSATINSIFDVVKFSTDAFHLGTKKVQDIVGTVQGIKVRVIDTPGLLSSCLDQRQNKKILHSLKHFIKKTPPDIVLYLDRLDMQSRDYGDLPLLRTITDIFGPSIWFNAIVVLTHAASAPPDGPNGTPLSYEMFVTQRSHVVQQAIRQAAGDMRLMNPVSLVENHSACRTNRAGQRVLPNGQIWKPHLLLLSFASKILAEANTLLKLQDSPPGKPFGTRAKIPPLPFLLSSLLQSRPPLKLPEEQFGDEETMDYDLDEASDSDEESEYDELPPFKRLTKAQLSKLNKEQKRAYFDELDYRENLFMKKQLKEEKRRRKLLKKMAESAKDLPNDYNENLEEDSGGAASVPVPVPDMPLPNSFDPDNPSHRYRYLDNSNQWLVRPVLETHGWDHDVGYEGVNVERLFVVKEKIPISFSGQISKDKKESNLQMELASSIKHSVGKTTSFGFDMQTVGKDMAYTLRSEVRFSNFRCNKTAAGLSVNILGDALSAGVKLEDILLIHKRLRLVMTGGAMTSRGDVAYGGTLEATLRDKDHPLGRTLSTLGLSIMDWHGDLALGCNLQSQFPVGRTTNMIARANLNNKGAGQVSIRLNSSEQLQIALVALVPIFQNIFKSGLFGSSQSME
ncbi:hypothetical protein AAC387_Pa07g3592 [Persea americana]